MRPISNFQTCCVFIFCCLATIGCDSENIAIRDSADADKVTVIDRAPDPLNLVAVDMPDFGAEVSRQWSARRDGQLTVTHVTSEQLLQSEKPLAGADLVVHPVSLTVDLISRELIRPVPRDIWDDENLNRDGMLRHYRKSLVRHDDQLWSISLGGRQLYLLYRVDVLQANGIEVPETWEDLNQAISKLSQLSRNEDTALAPFVAATSLDWCGNTFLARAAALIRDRGKITTLFDRKTMEPLVTAEPLVDSLNDLKKLTSMSDEALTPADAFAKFAAGNAVFALTYPTPLPQSLAANIEEASENWGIARVPGQTEIYDMKERQWQRRSKEVSPQVDALGFEAINISVTAGTSHASDAFDFATWLVGKQMSEILLSDFTGPFRATHLARLGKWSGIEQASRAFVDRYTDTIRATHDSSIVFVFPQIPGKQRYQQVLNEEVSKFLFDENGDAKSTLTKVQQRWESITDELGRDEQVAQLRQSSGF